MPQHLRKTALAHAALETHRAALDLRQRRALILANGKRSATELAQLIGGNGMRLIAELHESGYLESAVSASLKQPARKVKVEASFRLEATSSAIRR